MNNDFHHYIYLSVICYLHDVVNPIININHPSNSRNLYLNYSFVKILRYNT